MKEKDPVDKKIIEESIVKEMSSSYLDYAMSVITSRALPDVRDGLKPVHRRILFAMHKLGNVSNHGHKKSARIVGDVIGKYHPHGDSAVYDAMVRMAQPFSTRYGLVDGQGNFGSVDGDSPAAMRYTEVRMSKLSEALLLDIAKNTVDFIPNYDTTEREPTVLPAKIPNLLINGSSGIAVGMATNIPPHNLEEVCLAAKDVLDNPDITNEELLKIIKGPDFPTGAVAYDKSAIAHAYATGRGGVVVRGEAEIIEDGKKQSIIITSLPYRVNKSELLSKIAQLAKEKKIQDIKDLRDESAEDIRIVIELKSTAYSQKILNVLYKNTQLEDTFHFNMLALVDGVPQLLSLRGILSSFIDHRRVVVRRRTEFELQKAKDREHILIGFSIALDNIDKIVALIKKSKDVEAARKGLQKEFKLSEIQASAILEMKMHRLTGLERKKIEEELVSIKKTIKTLEDILNKPKGVDKEIEKELDGVIETFSDKRKTRINALEFHQ